MYCHVFMNHSVYLPRHLTRPNAEAQKSHLFTQMLYYCIARLQLVAGLIYSVLLLATHTYVAVGLRISLLHYLGKIYFLFSAFRTLFFFSRNMWVALTEKDQWPKPSRFEHLTITCRAPCWKSTINSSQSPRWLMGWKSLCRPSGKCCHKTTLTRWWQT